MGVWLFLPIFVIIILINTAKKYRKESIMLSIPQKEANLFVQSEVSKQYLWLVTALTANH